MQNPVPTFCLAALLLTGCGNTAVIPSIPGVFPWGDGVALMESSSPEEANSYDTLTYTDGTAEETDEEYEARIAAEAAAAEAARLKAEEEKRRLAAEEQRILKLQMAKNEAVPEHLPGYSRSYVLQLEEEEQLEALAMEDAGFVYYRQSWSVTRDLPYPEGVYTFGDCGCGATCTAMLISNLAGVSCTPLETRELALSTGSVLENGATTYNFIITTCQAYGLNARQVSIYDKAEALKALKNGELILVVVGPGDFTLGSHFMLFRGITDEGKILIADSYSCTYSLAEWDYDTLFNQLKTGSSYWIFNASEK